MTDAAEPAPAAPALHEAERASGPSGAVIRGPALDLPAAVARRQAGLDVVVCGDDLDANRRLAEQVEAAVGPYVRMAPHRRPPRPAALPAAGPRPRRPHLLRDAQPQSRPEAAMKYFTRQRYLALQRPDEAAAADADWEAAVDRYEASLQALRPSLSPAALELLDGHHLHDARVLSLARGGDRLIVTLQLEPPPQDLLTVTYELAGAPAFRKEAFPWGGADAPPLWLFDELEAQAGHLLHSVLLSNGWEIDVPFREAELTTARPLYPAPRAALAAPVALPSGHAG